MRLRRRFSLGRNIRVREYWPKGCEKVGNYDELVVDYVLFQKYDNIKFRLSTLKFNKENRFILNKKINLKNLIIGRVYNNIDARGQHSIEEKGLVKDQISPKTNIKNQTQKGKRKVITTSQRLSTHPNPEPVNPTHYCNREKGLNSE